MEAIAKHDFSATADDELSFRKNQILKETPFLAKETNYVFLSNIIATLKCKGDDDTLAVGRDFDDPICLY
uniref:Uncharacterized protein n=1 Tax=Glossina pallidipes TaxID=7398 RepID=A0A1A9ZGI2_GLOPL